MSFFSNIADSVREINRKYAKPEIEITLFVKICLLTLRLYLLAMVGLMVYALVKQAVTGGNPAVTTPAIQAGVTNAPSPVSAVTSNTLSGSQP